MTTSRRRRFIATACAALACAAAAATAPADATGTLSATLYIAGPATVAGGSTFTISPHAVVSGDNTNAAELDLSYPTSMDYLGVDNTGSPLTDMFLDSGGGGRTFYVGGVFGSTGVGGDILVDNTTLRAGCLATSVTINYLNSTGVVAITTDTPFPLTEQTKKIKVTAAPATSACAAPSFAGDGAKGRKITIYGSDFTAGATVSFGAGITTTAVSVATPTRLVATITVDTAAAAGTRDITITEPDASTLTCSACFTVDPAPTATSMSPNSLARGTSTDTSVYGSGFNHSTTVTISGTGVTATVIRQIGSRIDETVTVTSSAVPGKRTVTVHNGDGGIGVCHGCLTIT